MQKQAANDNRPHDGRPGTVIILFPELGDMITVASGGPFVADLSWNPEADLIHILGVDGKPFDYRTPVRSWA